jgi:hypothetical protein
MPIDPASRSQINSLDREGLSPAAIGEILAIPLVNVERALARDRRASREDREERARSLEPELTKRDRVSLDRLFDSLSKKSRFPLSLGLLLERWSDFVTEVEQGYRGGGEDYANELATRNILSQVLEVLGHPGQDKLIDILRPWDERLRRSTFEVQEPMRRPRRYSSESLRNLWWYWRTPEALTSKSAQRENSDVDLLASMLAKLTGFHIEQHVIFPATLDRPAAREIDLVVSLTVAGNPVSVAIEVKARRSGVSDIEAFAARLRDIGIPSSLGIHVARGGYSSEALIRARDLGIEALDIESLTENTLASYVASAFESTLYLLASVASVSIVHDPSEPVADSQEAFTFYDASGRYAATAADFTWYMWIRRQIPVDVGKHFVDVSLPTGAYSILNGKTSKVVKVGAEVDVIGMRLNLSKFALSRSLTDTGGRHLDKIALSLTMGETRNLDAVTLFTEKAELQEIAGAGTPFTHQYALPRMIFFGSTYWPPSLEITAAMLERISASERGRIEDPAPFLRVERETGAPSRLWKGVENPHPRPDKTIDRALLSVA